MIRRQFLLNLSPLLILPANPPTRLTIAEDEPWLRLPHLATHTLFLDASKYSPQRDHFRRAMAFLKILSEEGSKPAVVLGFHGTALAHVLPESVWSAFDLSRQLPNASEHPADHETAIGEFQEQVRSLGATERVAILACEQTLRKWVRGTVGSDPDDNQFRRFRKGILSPSQWVSAMVVSSVKAQQVGMRYVISDA